MMITGLERRRSPRVPVRCPIVLFYQTANSVPTYALDLSETGAAIEAPDPLPVGATVAFLLITRDHRTVDIQGRVIHVQPDPGALFRVGIQFTRLSPDDQSILAREREYWMSAELVPA